MPLLAFRTNVKDWPKHDSPPGLSQGNILNYSLQSRNTQRLSSISITAQCPGAHEDISCLKEAVDVGHGVPITDGPSTRRSKHINFRRQFFVVLNVEGRNKQRG